MTDKYLNTITSFLSGELSENEREKFFRKKEKDKELQTAFEEISQMWNSFAIPENEFDKERIIKLIAHKISIHKKQKANKFLYAAYKYAAVFTGLIVISIFVFNDLRTVKTIENKTADIQTVTLPDNSVVSLNSNSKIEYNNSSLRRFNRELTVEGEAYFEIEKSDNKQFFVHTPDFDIKVFGTKFNVRTYNGNESVVLTEGKISINKFKNQDSEIVMKPGEIVKYNSESDKFILEPVNSNIYLSWLSGKLEFDDFTLFELGELIKLRYDKELVINNQEIAKKRISGSAPSDDIKLIVKALETILKKEIIEEDNKIIIN